MKPARVFLPAILSGLLLWTAFFPLDLGAMSFVALAPFLTLVRAEGVGPKRRYSAAFLGGFVFFGLAFNWVRVAHPMMALFAWPGITVYCALYWPLALFLIRKLDRFKLPLSLSTAVVWVGLEYVRAHFPTGFSFLQPLGLYQLIGCGWYFLGYTVHGFLPIIQSADLGGVYLISFSIAGVNGSVYDWLIRSTWVRTALNWPTAWTRPTFTNEAYVGACTVMVPMVLICYGTVQLVHPPYEKGPRIAAVQGNLSQNAKMVRGDQKIEAEPVPLRDEYGPLARNAGVPPDKSIPAPDLVIWPETCWWDNWLTAAADVPDEPGIVDFRRKVDYVRRSLGIESANLMRTHALLGLNAEDWDGTRWGRANSAILITPTGEFAGRYDKMHLVPFGEYVPLKKQLPWLQRLTPYDHDYSCTPGESRSLFDLPAKNGKTYKFGVLICYEDSDPSIARRYNWGGDGRPGADFLVNISNDGWFDGTEQHEEHLAICRFRAVESRRSVVRAVNMGISAIIDPDGRMVALPNAESWEKSKKISAIVRGEVPIDNSGTLYAYLGDWVPALCWLAVVVGLVVGRMPKYSGK